MAEDTTRPYDAVRRAAAWRDRSGEGRVEVSGGDLVSWLQGLLTNDVAALRPGQGCYAAYLTPQGRMVSDVRVLRFGGTCWLDLPAVAHDRVLNRLEMFVITEDVTLRDLAGEVARVAVHGPSAPEAIGRALAPAGAIALAADLAALAEHHHLAADTDLGRVIVAAGRDLAVPGFDLYVATERKAGLVQRLVDSGLPEIDAGTWRTYRVEAGRPEYGVDMDEDTIPLEAGIEGRAISFTKGCYVGQEVIVRVRDRGHGRVARRLVGLTGPQAAIGEEAVVAAGDVLLDGEREVGRVTSAAVSPLVGRTIALGYVHRDSTSEGRAVQARAASGMVALTVTALPFRRDDGPGGHA